MGVDRVSIARIDSAINRWGDKFFSKFLSPEEILMVKNSKNAAGFWAAKEACAKALGCGICERLSFFDMTIFKTPSGAPFIKLNESKSFDVSIVHTSITHDGGFAVAVALVQK